MGRRRAARPRADRDGGIAQPDRVRIRAWAEVAGAWTVTDRRVVDGLSPFYVWTPDYAEKRLAWKRRHPLHVLLLRTYRIPRPVTVRVRDDYGGCRSWLEITRDLPFEGTPVLSDEEFERASEEIAAIVHGGAVDGSRAGVSARHRRSERSLRFLEHPAPAMLRIREFSARFSSPPSPRSPHPADGRRRRPALPGERRRRLPRHPPAGHERALQRGAARRLPRDRASARHCCDQLGMYRDLVYATPGLKAARPRDYFKDSSFGVRRASGDHEPPRADVTIVRDKGFGVPHVYGNDARRRDVRRRLRRRRGPPVLHGRAAPRRPRAAVELRRRRAVEPGDGRRAVGGRAVHRGRPPAPGRAADGPLGAAAAGADDATTTSRASTSTSPRRGSTRRRCRASTPRSAIRRGRTPWKRDRPDRHRLAGRRDLRQGRRPRAGRGPARRRVRAALRAKRRRALCEHFRGRRTPRRRPPSSAGSASPTRRRPRSARLARRSRPTAARSSSRCRARRRRRARPAALLPGALSLPAPAVPGRAGSPRCRRRPRCSAAWPARARPLPRRCPTRCSSPARESASGHPLMVVGPQVAYFNPQILMEEDVSHGPGHRRPRRRVRRHQPLRPARPRARLRVERDVGRPGHHRHVRGADLRRTTTSHYRFRGQCLPIEVLERKNAWTPTAADQTPPGARRCTRRAHQARHRRRPRAPSAASRCC